MAWVRFDNGIGGHRKALELSENLYLPALGLLLVAVAYCDQQRSDGYLPKKALPRIAFGDTAKATAELVRVGFFEKVGNGYQIHGYTEWQQSADQITSRSEKNRLAAEARWDAQRIAPRTAEGNADKTTPETDTKDSDQHTPFAADAEDLQEIQLRSSYKLDASQAEDLIYQFGPEVALEATQRARAKYLAGEQIKSWPSLARAIAKNVMDEQ